MRIFSTDSDGSLSLLLVSKNTGKLFEDNGGHHDSLLRVDDVLDGDDFCPHDARSQDDTDILEAHLAVVLSRNHLHQEDEFGIK